MPKGIPRSETIWLKRTTAKGDVYCITSKETRDCYFLYKLENNTAIKIAKGSSPQSLEEKYIKE